jgi:N-acetylmuramoyl-L-alanine amidase
MKAQIHVLVPATVAVAMSLLIASAMAARGHAPMVESDDSAAAAATTPIATATLAVANTPSAADGQPDGTMTIPTPTAQSRFPAPKSAQASTRARVVEGPSSLRQPTPTPQPHRTTIILDPGHGRGDPGAVHYTADGAVDLTEAEANEDIARQVRHFLEQRGYDVYVTRDGFGKPLAPGPLPRSAITSDLFDRVELAEAVEGDIFISIHNNGSTNPKQSGTEIWYCGEHRFGEESGRLADLVLDAAVDGLNEYGYSTIRRGTQEDSTVHQSDGFCQFLVTREVQMPSVLTELLFLTNDADAAVLKDGFARERVADHVAAAIDQFLQERGPAPAP